MKNLKLSDEDMYLLEGNNISKQKSGYYRVKNRGHMHLHRVILTPNEGEYVDHIDGDKSNNRRDNLRSVTPSLNSYNIKVNNPLGRGIYFDKYGNRYRACISVKNKTLKLGSSKDINVVKELYNKKAFELYGKDAYQHEIK